MTLADARRHLIRLLLYRYLQLDLKITTRGYVTSNRRI